MHIDVNAEKNLEGVYKTLCGLVVPGAETRYYTVYRKGENRRHQWCDTCVLLLFTEKAEECQQLDT